MKTEWFEEKEDLLKNEELFQSLLYKIDKYIWQNMKIMLKWCTPCRVTTWVRYVASYTVCLSCVTSIKSIFSKSCFLANNGTFSLYGSGEGSPVKREGTEWDREATLAQKRQRMSIQKAGVKVKSASMPATVYITQLALTWQITHPRTDLGNITGITSMWGRTVLQQCLQNVWHQSTFFKKASISSTSYFSQKTAFSFGCKGDFLSVTFVIFFI